MNGLQYIRIRCNLSLSELAEQMGVTRQAVSSWENGKKDIPKQRKKDLATYFGIDEKYIGQISEEDKEVLLDKAMFRLDIDGKEKYTYKPDPLKPDAPICFLGEMSETLDESFNKAKQRKKELIDEIDSLIDGGKASCLVEHIGEINRGCKTFEIMTTLLKQVPLQGRFMQVPFRLEMQNVFDAMLIAYAGKDKDELREYLKQDGINEYQDYEFIMQLADIISIHWNQKKEMYDEMYGPKARKSAHEWFKKVKEENEKLSREDQIARVEEDYKKSSAKGKVSTNYF